MWEIDSTPAPVGQALPALETQASGEANFYRKLAFSAYKPSEPDARAITASGFSVGRREQITRLLQLRYGGPCHTDDGEVWLECLLPYIVESTTILGRSPQIDGLKWAYTHVPEFVRSHGGDRVAQLIEAAISRRDEAAVMQAGGPRGYVKWLPTADELRAALRPTRAEAQQADLRGWRVIDPALPEEKREAKRRHMEKKRRAEGVQPMASRTKTKGDIRLAECLGISLATLKRRRKTGSLSDLIAQKVQAGLAGEPNPCAPYLMDKAVHIFGSRSASANDDAEMARSA